MISVRAQIGKVAVALFCVFHIASLLWWLIPERGYPQDHRTVTLFQWLSRVENGLSVWKQVHRDRSWARAIESYTFLTATWQRWWLFAPNPPDTSNWIVVKAVVGWENGKRKNENYPWPHRKTPLYDSNNLYQSYPEAEGMKRASLFYSHDPKLVENLVSGNWDQILAPFAKYWAKRFEEKNGFPPLGIHVIQKQGKIVSSGPEKISERVLWYQHY